MQAKVLLQQCYLRMLEENTIVVRTAHPIGYPTESTIYTIIATGSGGVSDNASVTVYIKPTASITASPAAINSGETATLNWSSSGATSCTISDIGPVEPSGTLVVSPVETTTYTLTATGPGGESDNASVTVTLLPPRPTVFISADPPVILSGGSTTLSWSTTGADTCTVQPGGYSVLNGSEPVTLTQPTTYSITATSPGGTASSSVTVYIVKPGAVSITSPTESALIERPDTLVRGTINVNELSGDDIGVTVNGVVAHVYGGEFAANHVPPE